MEDELQSGAWRGWKRHGSSKATLDGMARYAIPFGACVGRDRSSNLTVLAKQLGKNHELAAARRGTPERCEARSLAALIDEPARVTLDADGSLVPWS